MAKIGRKTIKWDEPSNVPPDMIGYRVYLDLPGGDDLSYASMFVEKTLVEERACIIPDEFPNVPDWPEGEYTIGVTTFDADGNEPDMQIVRVPFDLNPPPMVPRVWVE